MIDMISVGNKIHDLRQINKYSQDQLAELLLVSRQAISRWELGIAMPTIDNLIELTKLFSVSLEEILCMNQDIIVNSENIFLGHDRNYIVKKIINKEIKVNLPDVFYQFSKDERIMVLRAIKEKKLKVDIDEFVPYLNNKERLYLLEGVNKIKL